MRYLAIYIVSFLVWVGPACSPPPVPYDAGNGDLNSPDVGNTDLGTPDGGASDADISQVEVSSGPVWIDDVEIGLIRACGGCHGSSGCAAGSCFLDDFAVNLEPAVSNALCGSLTVGACHPELIKDQSMPPGGCVLGAFNCLTEDELDRLEAWVAVGMPEE